MSSICGIIDFESDKVSAERLISMGRAMVLRGREQSGAYIDGGVGIQHNRMILTGSKRERQPHTVVCEEGSYTVALDGELYRVGELSSPFSAYGVKSSAYALLESYISFGYETVYTLEGSFALAVYDKQRKEVLLAKDASGSKPLYYLKDGGRLVFASEIKGLLRYLDGNAEIDRAALRELILSPAGSIRATDIYKGICELEAGSFALHSALGTQISRYRGDKTPIRVSERVSESTVTPSSKASVELQELLGEMLIAFDYPCFDEYMPSFVAALKGLGNVTRATLEDASFKYGEEYALERADRIGMMRGIMLSVIPPSDQRQYVSRGFGKNEKKLADEVGKLFGDRPSRVSLMLGKNILSDISREKDAASRARSYALLLQSELWLSSYPLSYFQ